MKMLNNKHLHSHNINIDEYKIQFPDAETVCKSTRDRLAANAIKVNASRDYSTIGAKISKTKQSQNIISAFKGRKHTQETKDYIGKLTKERLAEKGHWNTGKKLSKETKQKISESLFGKIMSEEAKQNLKISMYRYRNSENYVPSMLGKKLTSEAKQKISESSSNFLLKARISRLSKLCNTENCQLLSVDKYRFSCKCNVCNNTFSFTPQIFHKHQRNKDICPICHPRDIFISKSQQEIFDFISQYQYCIMNDREKLYGKEIDIFIPSLNIGFEFAGLYWHSELSNPDKNHMLFKTKLANSNNIKLITIFESDWLLNSLIVKSRIKSILGLSNIIYARKCVVQEISAKQANDFLNVNHIQGKDKSPIRLGLFYNNILVSCATFCKPRFNKNHEWELCRFCNCLDTTVVGGASKLLSHFRKTYNGSIISYADRRWSDGNLYEKLGFIKIGESKPNYWYFKNDYNLIHRSSFQKHKLKNILENFDETLSEWENMKNNKWNRIWDCGNLVFSLTAKMEP